MLGRIILEHRANHAELWLRDHLTRYDVAIEEIQCGR